MEKGREAKDGCKRCQSSVSQAQVQEGSFDYEQTNRCSSSLPLRFRASRMTFSYGVGSGFHAVDQDHAFFVIDFLQPDFDDFRGSSLYIAAHILRFNRHFSVTTIDQHA